MNDIERIVSDLEQQREAIDRAISALREIAQPADTLKGAQPVNATIKPKKRHRISAAGRRAISEATKRRWALKRATESAAASKTSAVKTATRTRKAPQKSTAKKKGIAKKVAVNQTT